MDSNETKISEVIIIPIKPRPNGLIALASCVIDNKIYVGSLGIYTKLKGGYRITYPTKKSGKQEKSTINLFHPIDKQCGDAIEKAVIAKYEELMIEE